MVSIELWMAKIIGFMAIVRSNRRLKKYTASLMSELQELKNAISMPAETTETNRPWQKTMGFVNALEQAKVSDEEFAVLKRLVEKRSREAAQAQVTVTPVDTVQHCSPCTQSPEPLPDVCVKLENNEGKMDPKQGKLESSSAGTGLITPGQQCLPNEGTWETGRTTADGFLTASVGSNQGENIFFTHGTRGHHQKYDNICRHLFTNGTRWYTSRDSCDPGKTQAQDH